MDKKKKNTLIYSIVGVVVVVLVVTFGALAISGVLRDFNAQQYVEIVLDYTIKGEAKPAVTIMEGTTEEGLSQQYDDEIISFVENSILTGETVDDELKNKYVVLCKDIFAEMKYEVHEAEKISGKEYHVKVTYQPIKVFETFQESCTAEYQRIMEKVENGEYRGTEEEILAQMKQEYLTNSYTLLEEACKNMEYGKKATMTIKVVKGENDLFGISNEQRNEFFKKIMGLDAIQD